TSLAQQPDGPHDVLGRPLPWGEAVGGARLGVWMARERLLSGEPLELHLHVRHRGEKGPYVRHSLAGPAPAVRPELTTDRGDPVPFRLQVLAEGGSVAVGHTVVRLWPEGKFARGRYLVPGDYRLRAIHDARKDPADAIAWVGRLTSNTVRLRVLEGK